ncbi:MAG: MoaD/ThiS family protein [Chloroflexi bacterium]|nr:MoaD/ThiS family protein [Chloroflexota bacterium]
MQITVHFLASLRHTTKTREWALDVPAGATLQSVIHSVLVQYPDLAGQEAMWHLAINSTHADDDAVLQPGDRVSIFPYIGGG